MLKQLLGYVSRTAIALVGALLLFIGVIVSFHPASQQTPFPWWFRIFSGSAVLMMGISSLLSALKFRGDMFALYASLVFCGLFVHGLAAAIAFDLLTHGQISSDYLREYVTGGSPSRTLVVFLLIAVGLDLCLYLGIARWRRGLTSR